MLWQQQKYTVNELSGFQNEATYGKLFCCCRGDTIQISATSLHHSLWTTVQFKPQHNVTIPITALSMAGAL